MISTIFFGPMLLGIVTAESRVDLAIVPPFDGSSNSMLVADIVAFDGYSYSAEDSGVVFSRSGNRIRFELKGQCGEPTQFPPSCFYRPAGPRRVVIPLAAYLGPFIGENITVEVSTDRGQSAARDFRANRVSTAVQTPLSGSRYGITSPFSTSTGGVDYR